MSRRNPAVLGVWGPGKPRVRAVPATFNAPLKWNKKPWVCDRCGAARSYQGHEKSASACTCISGNKESHRRRVFSLSLGDWLDPEVPVEWLADMLDVIRRCPDLDFLLLTKRPELWTERMHDAYRSYRNTESGMATANWLGEWTRRTPSNPPSNIWLGVSVENQEAADRRIPELLKIPAKVRFLSVEPLLEEVNLEHWLIEGGGGGIDWCIVGGESGPNRRDCGVDAIVSVAEQCQADGVPVFVKQDCAAKPGQQGRIPDNIWRLKEFPTTPR
jgi:protein gp37